MIEEDCEALMWNRQRSIARIYGASIAARGRAAQSLKRNEGATLVETAVSTAIVMMLLFGVFDMSLAFYTYHYVSDAAREATRYAIVRGNMCSTQTPNQTNCNATEPQIAAFVAGLNYPGIDPSNLEVTTTWNTGTLQTSGHTTWSTCGTSDSCKSPGNQVQVTVVYKFPLAIPFVNFVADLQTLHIGSTSSMVISQ